MFRIISSIVASIVVLGAAFALATDGPAVAGLQQWVRSVLEQNARS